MGTYWLWMGIFLLGGIATYHLVTNFKQVLEEDKEFSHRGLVILIQLILVVAGVVCVFIHVGTEFKHSNKNLHSPQESQRVEVKTTEEMQQVRTEEAAKIEKIKRRMDKADEKEGNENMKSFLKDIENRRGSK